MTPTQVMEAEHRLIETVVKSLSGVAAAIEKAQRADVAMLETAVEFLRVYADKLHHSKEETWFFPSLGTSAPAPSLNATRSGGCDCGCES